MKRPTLGPRQRAADAAARFAMLAVVLTTFSLAGCVSAGGVRAPSGTGQSGGNGNVPTYTP